MINKNLREYIEKEIFTSYSKNDSGHNIDHIKYVINRSLEFAKEVDNINYDMVYTIAAYHDIGHYIDAKNHEKISSEILLNDDNLKRFFSNEEIKIMSDAVYDHRASLSHDPRTIYGKIVSSADRNVNLEDIIKRAYQYRINHHPNDSVESIIKESKSHLMKKFGPNGYANKKMYFKDKDYDKFLKDIKLLLEDDNRFREVYCKINNIKEK